MGKSILLVSTSAGAMGGNPTGLWLSELAEPYYAFKEAGHELTIASPAGGAIPIDAGSMGGDFFTEDAKKFMHDAEAVGALCHSKKLSEVQDGEFDLLYVAGGHGCCVDGPEMSKAVETFLFAKNKPVATVCHGPYCLIDAKKPDGSPLVAGLEIAGFLNIEEDQAGATEWVKANAKMMETEFEAAGATMKKADPWNSCVAIAEVGSTKLISGQNPQSAVECAKACLEVLA